MPTTDWTRIISGLRNLSRKKQLAFALLMLERMLPLLVLFSRKTGFDVSVYDDAKASAWNALENANIKRHFDWRSLSESCTKNAPDTESYSDELVSYALNAALSTSNVLSFAADHRIEHLVDIIGLAEDSIDLYIQSLDPSPISELSPRELSAHFLMRQEIQRQLQDIELLSGLPEDFSDEIISTLRTRASGQPALIPKAFEAHDGRGRHPSSA